MSSWEYTLAHTVSWLAGILSIPVLGKGDNFLIFFGEKYKILLLNIQNIDNHLHFISFNWGAEKESLVASGPHTIFPF